MTSPAENAPSASALAARRPQAQVSGQQGGAMERRMESLGWLTESAVMPKKHKAIEGVGAASILDLKAPRRRPASPPHEEAGRALRPPRRKEFRDKLELKAVKDGSVTYSALEKKAELYEKISREPENDNDDSMPSAKLMGLGRTGTTIDRDEHKRFVREVHEEVSEARQKASTLKSRRQEQEAARREKLRQTYLRKRLEKLIAEKQASLAPDDLPAN
ncbi:hypothetical protein GUJ93_ZPchr0007g4978 [Zizania palustris]|uniref:Uncharacterized protein n=1 Tax=Zizania palustris TaxID=103762 RepID=A0A8J5T349_ZIZPA|nr:hypothetical protein GUJ93_ZPchr0007g4978 [Zizania palustris]